VREQTPNASIERTRTSKHRINDNKLANRLVINTPRDGLGGGKGVTITAEDEARSELESTRTRRDTACAVRGIDTHHNTTTRLAEPNTPLSRDDTLSKVKSRSEKSTEPEAGASNSGESDQKPASVSTRNLQNNNDCDKGTIAPPNPQPPFHSTLSRMGYSTPHNQYHPSSSPSSWSERAAAAPQSPHISNTPAGSRPLERSSSTSTEVVDNTTTTSKHFVDDDEKSMEHSTATEPTQTTGLSHLGPGQAEEDDATTIRSLDSIHEQGLMHLTEDDEDDHHNYDAPAASAPASATCSVSTAPSTDEASSIGGVGNDWDSYDATSRLKQQVQQHRRVPSWEVSPHSQFSAAHGDQRGNSPGAVHLPPSFSPSWAGPQQRVASFRNEQQGYPPLAGRPTAVTGNNSSHWTHQHQTPPRYGVNNDPSLPFLPTTVGARGGHDSPRGMYHRQSNANPNFPYPVQQQQQQQQQQRKPYSQPPLPPSVTTPPRTGDRAAAGGGSRGHHRNLSAGGSPSKVSSSSQGGSRSSSEILKTLLRKKACLYEPDTSRAVALVTWLVGRELALQYGFFSRQQLQAGVHACVASKIEANVITRTKVNRCMQIILNSCFHYIIPRPDGSEESGDVFREVFAKEMQDDSRLLSVLPAPWNDITVNRAEILLACQEEDDQHRGVKKSSYETPQSSPQLGSVQSPSRESNDGDESVSKRAVLLCFNENVRRAEDVFRCHNEFIRDTAHACHLQLSSNEWRLFFGREAASTPFLWGNVGIPVPFMEGLGPAQTDALGVLTRDEVGALRTSWCCKRYDHDHELCGFAHSKVNGGWLRRDPSLYRYKDIMCQHVTSSPAPGARGAGPSKNIIVLNECPYGVNCDCAHSSEEIVYHPNRYKQRPCSSLGRPGGCHLGDVCPSFHPAESYRFPKKSDGRSPRHSRQAQQNTNGKESSSPPSVIPEGSPIVYASPAPISSFERHLLTPGLQSLFRRRCSVTRASIRGGATCEYHYSCFGDDAGIGPKKDATPGRSKAIGPAQQI